MTESTSGPEEAPLAGPDTHAGDIRDGGATAATPPGAALPGLPALPDSPDALGDPVIDEIRDADDPSGHEEYGLRSMSRPHGTDDDPGSFLNM